MSMHDIFKFRYFDVLQGHSGQRVNTDSCAFADAISCTPVPETILDLGSGTGVLSLMMAHKFPKSKIIAIEIDAELASIAVKNFCNSQFYQRIEMIRDDIRKISDHRHTFCIGQKVDLVICNPPFFINSQRSTQYQRANARHDINLAPYQLGLAAKEMMATNGTFWVFCATNEAWRFKQALIGTFFCEEIIDFANSPKDKPHREALKLRLNTTEMNRNTQLKPPKMSRIDYRTSDGAPSNWMIGHRKKWFPY